MNNQPSRVRLRAYKVGFGDCLLLTITYASKFSDGRRERHTLFDFGTRKRAEGGPTLAQIAAKIAEHCDGRLDVVVATHRHLDHINGFGDDAASNILDGLKPRLVIRPWTDVPEDVKADPRFGLDANSLQFISRLEGLHQLAATVDSFAFDTQAMKERTKELAALGIKNGDAIATLEDWGKNGRAEYVKAGSVVNLGPEVPHVSVRVLGPPTLDQVDRLTSYAKDSEEYWLQLAADEQLQPALTTATPKQRANALKTVAAPGGAGAAEWLLRTLDRRHVSQGLEIVEGFDDVLNNTSVILLITVGTRTLLLPGDAQAENWSFSLDHALGANGRKEDAQLRSQLANVDVYKVGHHGSRNATPKRLYNLWRSRTTKKRPLVSMLTTLHGVYEKSSEGKVPKDELITALELKGPVYNSDTQPADVWWMDIEAPTTNTTRFVFSQGRP